MSRETIYDKEIAPLMSQIIDICKTNDIPVHTTFVLDNGDACSTHLEMSDKSAMMRMFYYLCKAGDNFDAFLIAVMRDAQKNGHTSAYLHLLEMKAESRPIL